jgi:MFS family permease
LWIALIAMSLAAQMIAVAVGWQVYEIRRNPLDLGLIGLAEFVPLPLLALPAGQLADRLSRRLVFVVSLVGDIAIAALLLVVTLSGAHALWPFLVLATASGVSAALGTPAARALPPELVSSELLASAMAVRSTGMQAAVVAGPAVGGVLFVIAPELVYGVAVGLFALAAICVIAMGRGVGVAGIVEQAPGAAGLLAGIRFLLHTRIILGAILLDLFAVLFGGAIALAPVFARTILHVGPVGLGVLRSAPAAGGVVAGLWLTRRPLGGRAGRTSTARRRRLRRLHDRLRSFAVVRAVRGRARGERVRRHDQHEHPVDDGRPRDAGRASRARERRRDGVRQRVERARRLRIRSHRRAPRHRPFGRCSEGCDDCDRRRLAAPLPLARRPRPARDRPAGARDRECNLS